MGLMDFFIRPEPVKGACSGMKVKFWVCGNCGHEEPITDNDLQELNPVVSSAGAIKISCPNCGAYTISKPFDSSCMGGSFLVVRPHIRKGAKPWPVKR